MCTYCVYVFPFEPKMLCKTIYNFHHIWIISRPHTFIYHPQIVTQHLPKHTFYYYSLSPRFSCMCEGLGPRLYFNLHISTVLLVFDTFNISLALEKLYHCIIYKGIYIYRQRERMSVETHISINRAVSILQCQLS